MENWIHNLDSFYVTKNDQKINFSDDNTNDCGYESVAINFRKILLEF